MKSISKYLLFSIFVASFGSFLFGFNTAIISGALLYITDDFYLSVWQQGFLVSIILLGAIIGASFGGSLADYFGRKRSLFITGWIFFLGTIFLVIGKNYFFILIGRAIQGIGVGVVSLLVPLYLSEISPIKYRGAIVSVNQLAIVFGVVFSYLVGYLFPEWKMMFAFGFLPTTFLLLGLFFLSETPSFLLTAGKEEKAKKAFLRLHPQEKKMERLPNQQPPKIAAFKHLLDKKNRPAVIVGVGISIIQQITGINIVIYYAPKIFKMSGGLDHAEAILATLGVGVVNLFFTIVAIFLMDRVGRRKLLLLGTFGMALSLFFLALCFLTSTFFHFSFISILLYISFFSISLGPIAWLLIAEIFPLEIRGRAMGIATLSNWGANYLVSLSFLPLIGTLGVVTTFFCFALITIFSYYFVKKRIPETKNKSFEEIQQFWKEEISSQRK